MDTLSPAERSARMARVRAKDSQPEMLVRRMIHGAGFRYRLHRRDLPGTPDLAFPARKRAIFVHGCFWHRHSEPGCKLARLPKSRQEFWVNKLEGNRARDLKNEEQLRARGWSSLTIWECELRNKAEVLRRVNSFLGEGA
jgi:DNA mismatch endonuclease (patch repair protein)